jgi:putative colanic acid biosynthesis UDP-glucose lipid carrier transferase
MFDVLHAPRLLRSPLSLATAVPALLEPITILVCLFAAVFYFGDSLDSRYVLLAIILFSATFPGAPRLTGGLSGLVRDVVLAWLILILTLLLFGYVFGFLRFFPLQVAIAWALSTPVALILAHVLSRRILPRVMANTRQRAVIAGANSLGLRLAQRFVDNELLGTHFIGFFDDRQRDRLSELGTHQLLGTVANLPAFLKRNAIERLYIALPMASQPRVLKLLDELRDTTVSIYFVPDIFVADLIQARLEEVDGIPTVAVCETPFYGVNGAVKRISDLLVAASALVALAPLMLCIAALVKMTSPGPVLFKQRRYGLDGREIVVYKFRSMTVMEDGASVQQATQGDKRVTLLGAFLRKSSLDELPQFINVLQGRMSVVGPRPHAVAHNEQYRRLIKGYMMRHKVKPGITGWAQVNGWRGETETLDKMQKRIEYDLAYLRNWSLALDLTIILRTVLVVMKQRAAY